MQLPLQLSTGHNGGPPLDERDPYEGWRDPDEAQQDPIVRNRPNMLQRYSSRDAPLRRIVEVGDGGSLGRWVLLSCGHMRDIRDYDIIPLKNRGRRKLPTQARCGMCQHRIRPWPGGLAQAREALAASSG